MQNEFQVSGTSANALFTLKVHRGEGACLLAMNWKVGRPPANFVGFAIEYKEPAGDKFFALKNRLTFPGPNGAVSPNTLSTRLSPIQKFRWVHFPRNANLAGEFIYRVTPVFMNDKGELSYGEPQELSIELQGETYPGKFNVGFTRGFVSSQAFVDRYESQGDIATLLPAKADTGLTFRPTHPQTKEALNWMGFEAVRSILNLLDEAIADPSATVRVLAYDLNEPDIVVRLQALGARLKLIIDDDGSHNPPSSAESQSEALLKESAGVENVKRQHMGKLQHNKVIVVDGDTTKGVVCGSTNFSWRGFFVQANNAIVVRGATAIKPFAEAFDHYWEHDDVAGFAKTDSTIWHDLGLDGIDVKVTFSPHTTKNAMLKLIANDIGTNISSSLFYSLAFLYQTKGAIQDAIKSVTKNNAIFVYGISDKKVKGIVEGLDLQTPGGNVAPVEPATLTGNVPEPFRSEPVGGGGTRMHHKFVVIDFDKPSARVYMGSYNFSSAADTKNGENLMVIRDRKVAVAYMVEALRLFDHYEFRVAHEKAESESKPLMLATPPKAADEIPWWNEDYTDVRKARDRELFS